MSAYILSLCVASLIATVAELLAPRGEGGRLSAHVRTVAGLFLLVALLHPLRDGIAYIRDLAEGNISALLPDDVTLSEPTDYESILYASLSASTEAEVLSFVETHLSSEFGISSDAVTLSVVYIPGTADAPPVLQELRIALSGSAALQDPHPIEAYFADLFGTVCHVTVAI